MSRIWTTSAFGALLGAALATSVDAELIMYTYAGTITYVAHFHGGENYLDLDAGDRFAGSFTYDSSAPDTNTDPVVTFQPGSVLRFQFASAATSDSSYSYFYEESGTPPQSYLNDLYSDAEHPQVSDVYQFTASDLTIYFHRAVWFADGSRSQTNYYATFDTLSITTVPEPGTLGLLAAGLLGLGVTRRKLHI